MELLIRAVRTSSERLRDEVAVEEAAARRLGNVSKRSQQARLDAARPQGEGRGLVVIDDHVLIAAAIDGPTTAAGESLAGPGDVDHYGRARVGDVDRHAEVVPEVVAIVCPVGQVERLGYELHVYLLADLDVLGKFHIKFEEVIAAKRIKFRDRAIRS